MAAAAAATVLGSELQRIVGPACGLRGAAGTAAAVRSRSLGHSRGWGLKCKAQRRVWVRGVR